MISNIKAGELKKSIVDGNKMRLIDVRELEEFEKAHIENSQCVPVTAFKEKYQEILPDKNEKIVLICRSGGRSMVISIFLEGEGYEDIANFEGGVVGWQETGLPLTPTNEILASKLEAMPDFF